MAFLTAGFLAVLGGQSQGFGLEKGPMLRVNCVLTRGASTGKVSSHKAGSVGALPFNELCNPTPQATGILGLGYDTWKKLGQGQRGTSSPLEFVHFVGSDIVGQRMLKGLFSVVPGSVVEMGVMGQESPVQVEFGQSNSVGFHIM